MKAWGITDIGLKRHENQDTYAFEVFGAPDTAVAVVCDGMGGVNGGQLASSLAVSTFMEELHARAHREMTAEQVCEMESACVQRANAVIFERSQQDDDYHGMGTTLVAAVVSPDAAVICNVGDSRCYHIGSEGIRRVTRDHSVVESLIESGNITPEEARTHPNRNLITRALGPDRDIECDCFTLPFAQGDRLLLCSDGLIVTMEDDEMLETVRSTSDGEQALSRLVELAKRRGAPDNVTIVLILNDGEVERQNG
ncbi:MAG: Stp1/IreP family PP2C-type Ser/Thr phosphatase [Ruminococcaceae bacterium]|nr:Stp1/IreP family PP2C-type Ser/Thr phosphatase [Oscillospiraceae bacterium]